MRHTSFRQRMTGRAGVTLAELLVAIGAMGILAYASSMIYFSTLHVHNEHIWRLTPYDEATAAANRVSSELREAMLIDAHSDQAIVFVLPAKDANGDYVLASGEDGYTLTQGDSVAFYLSDEMGALDAQGNCLWMAVKAQDDPSFTPRVKVAEDIHPEVNPIDPDTGQPEPMFRYWPDGIRLWGVELYMTSISVVRGEAKTQTAHSEIYLRNL